MKQKTAKMKTKDKSSRELAGLYLKISSDRYDKIRIYVIKNKTTLKKWFEDRIDELPD